MEEVIQDQLALSELICDYQRVMLKTPKDKRTLGWFKTQLEGLEHYWSDFYQGHKKLARAKEKYQEKLYFKDDVYSDTVTQYNLTKTLILTTINPGRNQSSIQADQTYADAIIEGPTYKSPLPQFNLSKFSGDQLEWESFKGTFIALVHDVPTITPVLKLQYLLLSLTGDAAKFLKNVPVSADNYESAWKALQDQYDNKRVLLAAHLASVISCPAMGTQSVDELKRLLGVIRASKQAIDNLAIPPEKVGELWLIHHAVHKLDATTRVEWEHKVEELTDYPSYKDLVSFFERYTRALGSAQPVTQPNASTGGSGKSAQGTNGAKSKKVSAHSTGAHQNKQSARSCPLCQGTHSLYVCKKFQNMTQPQRLEYCKRDKLCLNCLQNSHFIKECPSSKTCMVCQGKHHTKLHSESQTNSSAPSKQTNAVTNENSAPTPEASDESSAHFSTQVVPAAASVGSTVLLATAQVVLADAFGRNVKIRALIDPGAERSFITERVLGLLTPQIKRVSVSVTGVGAVVTSKVKREASLLLNSEDDPRFKHHFQALVLSDLTRLLPKSELKPKDWPHLRGLTLADPTFFKPSKVDCIIGADTYPSILLEGIVKGPEGAPVAQQTVFGWMLTGQARHVSNCSHASVDVFHTAVEPALTKIVERFWEIEDLPQEKPLTPEEQYCEEYYEETTYRNSEGRFVVRLPFSSKPTFVGSRDIAVARLIRSEARQAKNPLLAEQYSDFMLEYIRLGHMEPVPRNELTPKGYYLPHHGIFKQESPNKIRVVFNASQPACNQLSLNDVLYPGPKLQNFLTLVITQWRFFLFAFFADIIKMFRQIRVHEDDIDWQRLVWRLVLTKVIQDYRALTVTYGTAPAPYLAIKTLKRLANEGKATYPEAALMILLQSYMDDIFGGADTPEEALDRRNQLINLLATACMQLGKWSANDPTLLQGLETETATEVPVNVDSAVSTLGLKWIPQKDLFIFKVSLNAAHTSVTKRSILSDVAKLFDPLGWIAPVLVVAKVLLQDLWLSKYDWDEPVQGELLQRWTQFRALLSDVSKIKISRWIGTTETSPWHLHGFADSSKRAYAAALYAVVPGCTSSLLMAKTKVAPTKVQTLPRLELCGATLLVKVSKHLLTELRHPPKEIHFWTDSQVVLDWLKDHPSRWQTFIANRVSEITTAFPEATWRHIKSAHNPVDCATRGLTPQQLSEDKLWWSGPSWIISPSSEWPSPSPPKTEAQEIAQSFVVQEKALCETKEEHDVLRLLERCSQFPKVRRTLAYCGRWKSNASKKPEARQLGALTVQELSWGQTACFKIIQQLHYSTELECLRARKPLPKRSNLSRLAPFINDQDLIRVGGRLENAPITYNEQHPIVLPGNSVLVRRLVEEVHRITLHGGVRLMQSYLGRSLWITRARQLITNVYRHCTKCIRFNARAEQQQMASLPAARLTVQRPFAVCGLDYAGPIPVLFSKGRGAKSSKGYVLLFVCFTVKAVHIEIVSDLTTEAFLAAFSRFAARRGVCSQLYSDNATTFKGASFELDRMFNKASEFAKKVGGHIAEQGTSWSFIPPRAPHFGGLWEAAVKSFKYHFKRVIGDSTLTFEELSTLAAKIEACMNSRPLCQLRSEPSDMEALTPAHFLVGTPHLSHPEPPEEPQKKSLLNRWRLLCQMRQSFWNRWRSEVLQQMQQRQKWLQPQRNLQVGDVVIIKDELSPPTKWPLGLVTQLHLGKKKLVRVVTLKTATTTLTRPVVNLIRLPTQNEVEDEPKTEIREEA